MSVYSTMYITRDDCMDEIGRALADRDRPVSAKIEAVLGGDDPQAFLRHGVGTLADRDLEDLLFRLVGDVWLNNFIIVPEYRDDGGLAYRPHREPLDGAGRPADGADTRRLDWLDAADQRDVTEVVWLLGRGGLTFRQAVDRARELEREGRDGE